MNCAITLSLQFARLLATNESLDALPGLLLPDAVSQARIDLILQRFRELTRL